MISPNENKGRRILKRVGLLGLVGSVVGLFATSPVAAAVGDGTVDTADIADISTLQATLSDQIFERFPTFLTVAIGVALLFIGITLTWRFIAMGFQKLVGGIRMIGRSGG